MQIHNHSNKGKTYLEIYGDRAEEMLAKRRLPRGGKHRSYRTYRGPDWQEAKRQVLLRDHSTCQNCGKTRCRLDVHHIIPWAISKDNLLANLVTLCLPCHKKADNAYIKEHGRYKIDSPTKEQTSQRLSISHKLAWERDPERHRRMSERMLGNTHSPKQHHRNSQGKFTHASA